MSMLKALSSLRVKRKRAPLLVGARFGQGVDPLPTFQFNLAIPIPPAAKL